MTPDPMIRVTPESLAAFSAAVLGRAGAAASTAEACGRALVEASIGGVDTHGVRLLPVYAEALAKGQVRGAPQLRSETESPALISVDADGGLGHLPSFLAMDLAMDLARSSGLAAAVVRNSSHHGATGVYTAVAARKGFLALGTSSTEAAVAPHGGRDPFFGTNPLSFAAPLSADRVILLDMATSAIPLNRAYMLRSLGAPLAPDVALDKNGAATREPADVHALLPLGGSSFGYKGAGIAFMLEILAGLLAGMPHAHAVTRLSEGRGDYGRLGHFFLVIDPERFLPREAFETAVRRLVRDLAGQPASGGEAVMYPGQREAEEAVLRTAAGVPIDAETWRSFTGLALAYDLQLPVAMPSRE